MRLQLLAVLLGAGAAVPPRPLQRSAPPSALHLAIYSGEVTLTLTEPEP